MPPAQLPHQESTPQQQQPLPEAILVYHESAHSIVFRDHLRRQLSAIRRTTTDLESSTHSTNVMPVIQEQRRHALGHSTHSSIHSTHSEEDSSLGYKAESDMGYESTSSHGSHSSLDKSDRSKHLTLKHERKRATVNNPVAVANFQPVIEPLERLELNAGDVFGGLVDADPGGLDLTEAEVEVVELLRNEKAVVKTIRNSDWTAFLQKFAPCKEKGVMHECHPAHRHTVAAASKEEDRDDMNLPFNSFVTSTSLLPSLGKKMRCFGSTNEYPVGVIFALPSSYPNDISEDAATKRTRTWSWPSGYSAKTEFNIGRDGNLINGREEALVPLSGLREMNRAYLFDTDYVVGGRMVKGGLNTIPYNEVYIRVGGLGRISKGKDVSTGNECNDEKGTGRSLDHGVGLPIALFVRQADYKTLVGLLRTRSRFSHIFGRDVTRGLPLLYITPETGVRVFTENLQQQVLKKMAWDLNPFQNPCLAHHTGVDNTSESHLKQKLEELLDLDDENCLKKKKKARIAGGFGATDESVAQLLNQALERDIHDQESGTALPDSGHSLQDLVNEGLAFALRSSDYHTSRQLLILYTLISSKRHKRGDSHQLLKAEGSVSAESPVASPKSNSGKDAEKDVNGNNGSEKPSIELSQMTKHNLRAPPPPPLDTDRLRSATNSDGLLAVLGAAQVLRAMQDGSAKRRVTEAIESIEEWIENGEQSVAFRVASWRDQRAAQGDLKIAMESDSNFMAFISNKSISNRKKFAKHLRAAAEVSEFDSLQFLRSIHNIVSQMHSPCLRLELLQYILGLDNRYSVAHVKRSIELAATCLNISESDVFHESNSDDKLLAA